MRNTTSIYSHLLCKLSWLMPEQKAFRDTLTMPANQLLHVQFKQLHVCEASMVKVKHSTLHKICQQTVGTREHKAQRVSKGRNEVPTMRICGPSTAARLLFDPAQLWLSATASATLRASQNRAACRGSKFKIERISTQGIN